MVDFYDNASGKALHAFYVSADWVIAPDCTEKLESTSTLRFQTSARIVHELLDYSEPMAPLNMCRSRSIIHDLAVNEYPGAQ
jgi:hypothetical protein